MWPTTNDLHMCVRVCVCVCVWHAWCMTRLVVVRPHNEPIASAFCVKTYMNHPSPKQYMKFTKGNWRRQAYWGRPYGRHCQCKLERQGTHTHKHARMHVCMHTLTHAHPRPPTHTFTHTRTHTRSTHAHTNKHDTWYLHAPWGWAQGGLCIGTCLSEVPGPSSTTWRSMCNNVIETSVTNDAMVRYSIGH